MEALTLPRDEALAFAHPSPSIVRFRDVIARLRYRPSWAFLVWDSVRYPGRYTLQARWDTHDSDEPSRLIRHSCSFHRDLAELVDADEATLVARLWWLVEQVEAHERREFFEYAGKRLFDPHPEIEAAMAVIARRAR